MRITPISKTDTLYFKAIGILLIVFHNYFHWLEPRIGENDIYFSADVIKKFWYGITNTPLEAVNLLFSGFGHYGVQIFILMSGVGLAVSMAHKQLHYGNFMWQRLKKIYIMLFVSTVLYSFAGILCYRHIPTGNDWLEAMWRFLLIHTIMPGKLFGNNGPLWFIGLIFQLYLFFPLLLKIIKKYNLKGLVAICLFSYICTYTELYLFHLPKGIYWFANSIAHLPEFALGIFIAMNAQKKIPSLVFICAAIIFVLGNFFQAFFPLSFLAISLLLYFVISKLTVFIQKSHWANTFLIHIGTLSMALFITHGFLRNQFKVLFNNTWYDRIIGTLLFFITAYAVALLANMFYKWIYKLLFGNRANGKSTSS